jgi:hypothetical protein
LHLERQTSDQMSRLPPSGCPLVFRSDDVALMVLLPPGQMSVGGPRTFVVAEVCESDREPSSESTATRPIGESTNPR